MQTGYIKRFNGKFRDEGLSLEWFRSAREAAVIPLQRRAPHSSLNYMPLHEFKQHDPVDHNRAVLQQ